MIIASISNEPHLSLGLQGYEDYANFIAIISKYHRELNIEELENTYPASEKMKFPFLTNYTS